MSQATYRYRLLFLVAALFNFGLAIWSGLFPRPFFALFDMVPPDAPLPWSWVAILIGCSGFLYLYAAWWPERADLVVAIGLIPKVVGPSIWLFLVADNQATPAIFPVVLWGDLIWWQPFCWYLLRQMQLRATIVAWLSVLLHLVASLGLLLVAEGTELNEDFAQRQQWIQNSTGTWVATWTFWSLSSISLLALCGAWSWELHRQTKSRAVIVGCGLIAVGLVFDLAGETVAVVQMTRQDLSLVEFAGAARVYQWLSPGIANGLYCIGGFILSWVAWKGGHLTGLIGVAGFLMWFAALVLTCATLVNQTALMTASGALIMMLYLPWAAGLGWRWRTPHTQVA